MKNLLLAIVLVFSSTILFSQKTSIKEVDFKINLVSTQFSISNTNLKSAQTLTDLNSRYEADWVREYISVDIITLNNGEVVVSKSINNFLTVEQKKNIENSDAGSLVEVKVHYIPENSLAENPPKENGFKFYVEPDSDALYEGGREKLYAYLENSAIRKIPSGTFEGYAMAVVKFNIDAKGAVISPQIFWSSESEQVDKLLLQTIEEMPNWIPAGFLNGTTVEQEYAWTIGNHESCVINMLNIQ